MGWFEGIFLRSLGAGPWVSLFFRTEHTFGICYGEIIGRGSTWYLGWVGVLLVFYMVETNTRLVPGTYCSNSDGLAYIVINHLGTSGSE
jgi:hypothetical protein